MTVSFLSLLFGRTFLPMRESAVCAVQRFATGNPVCAADGAGSLLQTEGHRWRSARDMKRVAREERQISKSETWGDRLNHRKRKSPAKHGGAKERMELLSDHQTRSRWIIIKDFQEAVQ